MGLVKLTVLDLRNKVPKIQGQGVAISPPSCPFSLSLFFFETFFCDFFVWDIFSWAGGGGRGLSLFQVHLLILLGPPVVFIPGAFFNPIWTLSRCKKQTRRYAVIRHLWSSCLLATACRVWDTAVMGIWSAMRTRVSTSRIMSK